MDESVDALVNEIEKKVQSYFNDLSDGLKKGNAHYEISQRERLCFYGQGILEKYAKLERALNDVPSPKNPLPEGASYLSDLSLMGLLQESLATFRNTYPPLRGGAFESIKSVCKELQQRVQNSIYPHTILPRNYYEKKKKSK